MGPALPVPVPTNDWRRRRWPPEGVGMHMHSVSSLQAGTGRSGVSLRGLWRRGQALRGLWTVPALLFMALVATLATALVTPGARAAHAVAYFGEPKYPAGFHHFDYVNPDAPKRGQISFSQIVQNSSFDTFNPLTLRGKAAPGLLELAFETLTIYSLDELSTQYGLLADDILVAPDQSSVTFHINPAARFNNGDPVTAGDVKYSFATLTGRKSNPRFKSYFSEIAQVVVVNRATVRFEFKRKGRDLSFVAGSLPVFSPKWGRKPDGKPTPFDELKLEQPVTSGPYKVERSGTGQNVIYTRNPQYWGKDLAVRRGSYNFDRVVYKLYKDKDTLVSAIRAGDFDFFPENQMRYWCCQFIGERFDSGELLKDKVTHHNPRPMNGYVFNLRRPQFQDIRVREALNLAYDWQWLNRMVFDDEFERQDSYFANSPLAATGSPSEAELKLLEPYRAELPPAVFGPMYQQPDTRPPNSIRKNLAQALDLFKQAGWERRDGVLRNAEGKPFEIEVSARVSVLLDAYFYNLKKLGVVINYRTTDPAVDRARLRQFDYDFASISLREARLPGPELLRSFSSREATKPGSDNIVGLQSKPVDELIDRLLNASSQEELETTAHALDRVLTHGHYVVPWRYLKNVYYIHHRRLKRPEVVPDYFGPYEWVLTAWWDGGDGAAAAAARDH
jgi:microcin C transport system substrate-binding protein